MDEKLKYQWTRFDTPVTEQGSFDVIMITNAMLIILPREFCAKNKVNKYQYANFRYDGTALAIGIEFTDTKQQGSTGISWHRKNGSASLKCVNFFKAIGLDAEWFAGSYSYTVSSRTEGKPLYVIDLAPYVPIA